MYSPYIIFVLVMFVLTGANNTIMQKTMNLQNSVGVNGENHKFEHAIFQTFYMFIGESMCLGWYHLLYYYHKKKGTAETNPVTKGNRHFNVLLVFIPALFDLTGTCFSLVGLIFTYASSYQMFRATAIIFTAIFGRIFLKSVITFIMIVGLFLVIVGLTLVGIGDYILQMDKNETRSSLEVVSGDFLVIIGMVFQASQVVYEERLLRKLDIPPMISVGWEGIYGSIMSGLLMIPAFFIPAKFFTLPRKNFEDAEDVFLQLKNNWLLMVLFWVSMFSMSFYNFFLQSVTKELTGITSMVFNALRTTLVWIFGLAVFKQEFHYIQFLGFVIQITGTIVYNGEDYWKELMKKCRKKQENDEESPPKESADVPGKSDKKD